MLFYWLFTCEINIIIHQENISPRDSRVALNECKKLPPPIFHSRAQLGFGSNRRSGGCVAMGHALTE